MSIHQVISTLKELNDIHVNLIEIGREKQRAIIENDSAVLTTLMTKENRLLKQMNDAETRRGEAVSSFLTEKGIRSQLNLTVSELVRLVFDQDEKRGLLEARDLLLDNALVLKKQNEHTKELLEQSLHFIDFSLNLILGVDEDLIYSKPTGNQPLLANRNNYFDTKA
ncbi:flagellar protein FlgN [Paenibacillus humicus]|uniref:flagellar protein FlgN n=1 Tax=Paenibacillus humicus TaxID=412861 RepID=UPI003D2C2B26